MKEMDKLYPGYGFAEHKGYSTPQHYAAIEQLGACPIHRKTFAPFRPVEMELGLFTEGHGDAEKRQDGQDLQDKNKKNDFHPDYLEHPC